MSKLANFESIVAKLEGGHVPAPYPNLHAAAEAIADQINVTTWRTTEERNGAQYLIIRLERLMQSRAP